MRHCFFDGIFCNGKHRLIRIGDTYYCPACFVASRSRAMGEFPNRRKPGTRYMATPGSRYRGTHVAHAN